MEYRKLGENGPEVSALGLGTMGLSPGLYGEVDDEESIGTINHAIDVGINFIDTANVYGGGSNEELVGRAIRDRRDEVVLATKFGIVSDENGNMAANGRPEYVREQLEGSLARLGFDHVDLYYIHRVDQSTPIEETIGAMAELVSEGKVRYLGISEAGEETIRRAHATHPVTAIQSEYSLWTRDPEQKIFPTLEELGIGFVPYMPLGAGFLIGRIRSFEDLSEDDFRRNLPRYQPGNIEKNVELADRVGEIADSKGATPAQVALAWFLSKGESIIPIFGTRRAANVESNAQATGPGADRRRDPRARGAGRPGRRRARAGVPARAQPVGEKEEARKIRGPAIRRKESAGNRL